MLTNNRIIIYIRMGAIQDEKTKIMGVKQMEKKVVMTRVRRFYEGDNI